MSQHAQHASPSRASSGTSGVEQDRHPVVVIPKFLHNSQSANGQPTLDNSDEAPPPSVEDNHRDKFSIIDAPASPSRQNFSTIHKSLPSEKNVKFRPSGPGRTSRGESADHIVTMSKTIEREKSLTNITDSPTRPSSHSNDGLFLNENNDNSRKHPVSCGSELQKTNLDRLTSTASKEVVPDEHSLASLRDDKPPSLGDRNTGNRFGSLVGDSDKPSCKSRVRSTHAGYENHFSSNSQSLKTVDHSQDQIVSSPGRDSDVIGTQENDSNTDKTNRNGAQVSRNAIVSADQSVTGAMPEPTSTSAQQSTRDEIQTCNRIKSSRLENPKSTRTSLRKSTVIAAGKTVAETPFNWSDTVDEQPSQSMKRQHESLEKPSPSMNHHSKKSQSNGTQERSTKALRRESYETMDINSNPLHVESTSQLSFCNSVSKEVTRDDTCLDVPGHTAAPSESVFEDGVQSSETGEEFLCTVDTSTFGAHRIVADIGGQQMVGWVVPVDGKIRGHEGTNGHERELVSGPNCGKKKQDGDIKANYVERDDMHSRLTSQTVLSNDVPQRSVIIIGAGIAGIAAARALTDRGFNVVVLESRGRVGGRIATDWTMGSPVELGACFIHGSYGNPLAMIAREAELRTYSPTDVQNLMFANGDPVSPSVDRDTEEVWRALTRRAERIAETVLAKREVDVSLGSVLKKLQRMLREPCSKEMNHLLSWHASNLELACAADLDNLSARHYDMDVQFGFSGPHEIVRDGYSSIVQALAQNLDIRLNSVVTAVHGDVKIHHVGKDGVPNGDIRRGREGGKGALGISHGEEEKGALRQIRYLDKINESKGNNAKIKRSGWDAFEQTSQKSGVRVLTEDGMAYLAEYCLVTVPLGVLKKGDIKFSPALPNWKRDAVEGIGFGVVNKVALRFDQAFWVEDRDGSNEEIVDEDGPDHIGRVPSKHGIFTMFLSMVRCTGAPILVAITAGKFAKYIERQTDAEVVRMAMEALNQTYGAARVGRLIAHRVTRWGLDRFSRGSYSYAKVGSSPQDYAKMCEPVGKVFFAGEATHRSHPATAHGAFMSGIREASRIIERSDLNSADKRRMAMELYMMQEPHRMGTISPGQRDVKRSINVTGSSRFHPNGNVRRNARGR